MIMKTFFRILFYLLFLLHFSCTKKGESIALQYYDNGKVKSIKAYKNGILNGESTLYYENGNLKSKIIYKNGLENGHAYYFFSSGALESHRFWVQGKMTGYVADYWDGEASIIKNVLLFNSNGDLIYKKEYDSLGNFIKEEGHK